MDFTLSIYKKLLDSLLSKKYQFVTVEEYFTQQFAPSSPRLHASSLPRRIVIMRHDVDRKPANSLRMAHLEAALGVKATYYFRTIAQTLQPQIIKEIAELGHEIGYHYENLATANSRMKNVECNPPSSQTPGLRRTRMKNVKEHQGRLYDIALEDFEENLAKLREIVPIKNICMHGSPLSKLDSRDLWKHYNYKDYGIISEPYFDIDYQNVFYITDTGRQWNNSSISVRDKVNSGFDIEIKSTYDLIQKLDENILPQQLMINAHPHRWFSFGFSWLVELIMQNLKNQIKRVIIKNNG